MAFIKICGMTDARAVEAALAAGADAIGFVFAPSVRRVTPQQAELLARPARGRALCVAVTQHPDPALLQEIFSQFRPDVLQTDAGDLAAIKLPESVVGWPVLRATPSAAMAAVLPVGTVRFEGPRFGTGKVADWQAARKLAATQALVLEGGLSPENVAEAIGKGRPLGVDVASGVEEAPGRKSPERIGLFVTTARAAFARSERRELK